MSRLPRVLPDLEFLFYTFVQVNTGRADEAIRCLRSRLERHPEEPESLALLVQAFLFRGLLDESLESHRQAVLLDPDVVTSVAHTWFLAAEYDRAIAAYGGRAAFDLEAAAWAALGHEKRAIALLSGRLAKESLSSLMNAVMRSLLALLDGRIDESVRIMDHTDTSRDPEILVYFARHYARGKHSEKAAPRPAPGSTGWLRLSPNYVAHGSLVEPIAEAARRYVSLLRQFEAGVQQAKSRYNFL